MLAEIITINRTILKDRLKEFCEIQPEHVFIIDIYPPDKEAIFTSCPKTEFFNKHTLGISFDINSKITKIEITKILDFITNIINTNSNKTKKLIIACKDGRRLSGTMAVWVMEWLMGEDKEDELYKKNPDILPNENILNDLLLYKLLILDSEEKI